MWSDFRHDAAYALRALRKTPGFTVAAVVTLALGIGANTAIFSVIDSVLLRPQPYRDADRLVFFWTTNPAGQPEGFTGGRLVDFREQLSSVTQLSGFSHIAFNLTGSGEPERIAGASVSSSFFDVLGVPPLLGDPFHANRADDRAVVLSYALWRRRFGGDPAIIGRQIILNGTARIVVAVMPQAFEWPTVTATAAHLPGPQLWVPGGVRDIPRTTRDDPSVDLSTNRVIGYLRAVGRLKDGVTLDQARREAEGIAVRLAKQYPKTDGGRGATLVGLREQTLGQVEQPMLVLLGGVAFVLAIACANIAGLLLARSAARRRELGVRLALGASRGRIVRQLLTETMLVSLAGAAVGIAAAWWIVTGLIAIRPAGVPGLERAAIDGRVFGFTLVLAVITGLLCGLAPAWQASSGALTAALGDGDARGTAGRRSTRTRDALVAAEIAIALVLLVGAGLLLRSFTALSRVDVGIDARNLLTFQMILSGPRAGDPAHQTAFFSDAVAAVAAVPGVRDAAAAVTLPIGGDAFAAPVVIEGTPAPPPGHEPRAGFQVVTPGFFRTMGIPILEGRDFRAGDTREAAAVAVVNRAFARQHWPDSHVVGRRMTVGSSTGWMTVVGVVEDIRHLGPSNPPRPEFYRPHTQLPFSFMAFVVRTHGDAMAVMPPIRAAIASLDPSQPIAVVSTMEEHLASALSRPKFMSTLIGGFGAVALLLAVVGIYGVMAFTVSQRTREIAVRMALGARRSDVMGMVLKKASWLAGTGIAAGLAGAFALSRVIAGLLFGVTATDAATYVGVSLALAFVALVAALIPARRAAAVDGTLVLR